jgi:hypothetical protein
LEAELTPPIMDTENESSKGSRGRGADDADIVVICGLSALEGKHGYHHTADELPCHCRWFCANPREASFGVGWVDTHLCLFL